MVAKQKIDGIVLRKFWRSFWLYAIGVFLVYSAFGTLLSLQSSINVVDGLGTFTLATIYGSAVAFTLLFVPTFLRHFGVKKCICGAEVTYVIYTLANLYPTFYTMVPASFIVGMGDGTLWSCMPFLNSFYAKKFSLITGDSTTNHEPKFSGYFYAVFQMSKVSGNLISYTVLYAFNTKPTENYTNTIQNTTISSMNYTIDKFQYCGAKDCQDASVVTDSIEQYVPASKVAIYLLMSIMAFLCCVAVVIHAIFIPNTEEHGISRRKSCAGDIKRIENIDSKLLSDEIKKDIDYKPSTLDNVDANFQQDDVRSDLVTQEKQEELKDQSYISFTLDSLRDIGLQIITLKQLLLTPIILYVGLDYGFITSEITRAYSACVYGVEWIPIHVTCYGLGAAFVCYVVGKLSRRISRYLFFAFAFVVDVCMYIYILLWEPQDDTHLSVVPVYFLMGGMQGIWIPMTHVVQLDYFSERLDVASPVWNVWFMLGIAAQFAWSTSVCVSTKIYTQLGVLAFSVLCYGIAEKIFTKSQKKKSENSVPSA